MPTTVDTHEARFSRLLARVETGEEIVIARAGRPVVRLIPVKLHRSDRHPGTALGQVKLSADFEAPLPNGLLETLE
jgi:prevent-host-death family protein